MKISEKNTAIIGASFGDEAKGSIAWKFSKNSDVIVKYNGSGNAGHTVYYKGQKIVRRQLPSADFQEIAPPLSPRTH